MSDTSKAAHEAVKSAHDYADKNALILLSLWVSPSQLPWDIAEDTGQRHDYVKSRCTEAKDFGLIRETTKSRNPDTGRPAMKLDLTKVARETLDECIAANYDPLESARDLFLIMKSEFEAELERIARENAL